MADAHVDSAGALAQLVKVRARMTILISIIMIVLLAGNMLLMSSWADLGAQRISEGSNITVVLAYSVFVVVIGACIAGFYVWWANNVLDPLADKAREALKQAGAAQ